MLTKLSLLIIPFLIATNLRADEWMWQHPLPQGNTLWKVRSAGSEQGFAVGDFGTIMVTYDNGASWELQYEAITDNLRDIQVQDPNTAWIAGDNGTILHTINGGVTWLDQFSNTTNGLNCIFFYDADHGWAGGDRKTLRYTANGGNNWNIQALPAIMGNPSVNSIYFVSLNEGWAVGSGGNIWHTTDGGNVWSEQYVTGIAAQCVKFYSPVAGFVLCAGGYLYMTTNSGATWSPVLTGATLGLNDIVFAGPSDFWITGDNGTLLHSTTAGTSWMNESLSTYADLNGIDTLGTTMVVMGEFGAVAQRTPPSPWSFTNPGNNNAANWITFYDQQNGFCVGQYGMMLRTSDSGTTWENVVNGLSLDSFYGVQMIGSDRVWVVGDLGVMLYSSDRGSSWVQQTTLTTNTLLSVSFVSQNLGWAVGDLGTLIKTSNGGATWGGIGTGYQNIFFGVTFKDEYNGWIVGDNGLVLRTTNGGATWIPQNSGTGYALFAVDFIDFGTGFCAGAGGTILKTTNGGWNWTPLSSGTSSTIYVVSGVSTQSLWAVGDSGVVLHSTDGGTSWSGEFPKHGYDIFGLMAFSDSLAWICGDIGTILKTGGPASAASVTVNVNAGWNLVANPVDTQPGQDSLRMIYPTSFYRYAYAFNPLSGYIQSQILQNGVGYWCKFGVTQNIIINGRPLTALAVSVSPGWNMISGTSFPVDTSNITSIPAGIRRSEWFGYSAGYYASPFIQPGQAYWVKVGAPGQFVISAGPSFGPNWSTAPVPTGIQTGSVGSAASKVPTVSREALKKGKAFWGMRDRNPR